MDRVGFEPTTSAHQQRLSQVALFIFYLKWQQIWKENVLLKSHPVQFFFAFRNFGLASEVLVRLAKIVE
jgi:hypothetical protein